MKVKLNDETALNVLSLDLSVEDMLKSIGEDGNLIDPELDIVNYIEQQCRFTEKYDCGYCPKSYFSKRSFIRHTDLHLGRFTCPICSLKCTSNATLHVHLLRHQRKGIKVCLEDVAKSEKHIWCSLCKRYIRKNFLQFHLKRSHINEKRFRNLNKLLRLIENETIKEKLFKCNVCDKSYVSYSSLKTHRNIHSKKFYCQICDKTLTSSVALRRHLRTHNVNSDKDDLRYDANYSFCEICDKYVNKYKRKHHENTVHNKQLPTCHYCLKTFQTKAHIVRHMNTHLEIRKFQCFKCGKLYKQNTTLLKHLKKHH